MVDDDTVRMLMAVGVKPLAQKVLQYETALAQIRQTISLKDSSVISQTSRPFRVLSHRESCGFTFFLPCNLTILWTKRGVKLCMTR